MRLLRLASVLLALVLPLLLAPAEPRCAFFVQDECQTSAICGHGCFCLKKGMDIMGHCFSQGLDATMLLADAGEIVVPLGPVKENVYGPGIHSDGTGRPFVWEGQVPGSSYRPSGPVKPDAYGPGVGMDKTGRPVRARDPFGRPNGRR